MQALYRKPSVGYLGNWLHVPKGQVNVDALKSALTFRFVDNYSEEKVRIAHLWDETEHHLLVPRCLWPLEMLQFPVIDVRPRVYERTHIISRIKLDHRRQNGVLVPTGEDLQERALAAVMAADSGILQLGCGRGKTVIALEAIARSGGPGLVVVDNTTLLEQWLQAIDQCLIVPGGIGRLQADICDWRGRGIVLATYQTLAARSADLEEGFSDYFMTAVYDEAHHLSAVTFAKGAPIIRGKRLALTATPKRDDGTNVIYDNHIGPVIFKDVTHAIKPRIVFKATGIDVNNVKQVCDKDGNVHVSKLGTYFGSWLPRLQILLNDVQEAAAEGRKILVLSNTVDEAVNLCALWTQRNWHDPAGTLYSDIPLPEGLGQTGAPLTEIERELIEAMNDQAEQAMTVPLPDHVMPALQKRAEECKRLLEVDDKRKGLIREYRKRQKDYLNWLMGNLSTAGLMIYKIPAQQRMEYLRTKQIVFAITKYGREGLDDEYLDTVLVSIPFSSRNLLQQLMGRPTRQKPGKKDPLIVFYLDNVGQLIGMCKKLQHHLDYWPVEESGPFEYEIHGQGARSAKYAPLWTSPERTA